MLHETLLLLLLGLPQHHLDVESAEARKARLQTIGRAVADAAEQATCDGAHTSTTCTKVWPGSSIDLGVLLITLAWEESRLARNVHEGKCRAYECDPIRDSKTGQLIHRARSLWQIHRVGPVLEEWDELVGCDYVNTRAAAWAATKLLSRGFRACKTIQGAMAQYAGVGSCRWEGVRPRHALFRRLRERARAR